MHGVDHMPVTEKSLSGFNSEITTFKDFFNRFNLTITDFSFPFGFFSKSAVNLLRSNHIYNIYTSEYRSSFFNTIPRVDILKGDTPVDILNKVNNRFYFYYYLSNFFKANKVSYD